MSAGPPLARRPPLAVLIAVSALQPFALNVLAPATPGLARSFATDYGTIQLTLTLYLVAVALSQVVVGPISDRIGRRPCILAGVGLFVLGSVLGAFAADIATLLAARVVQAVGGGTCFALSRAVVRDTAEKDEAASLFGYITMVMVLSPMVAPLIGGFLDARLGWRTIFWVKVGLALPVAVAAILLLNETRQRSAAASVGDMIGAFPILFGNPVFLGYALAIGFTTASFFTFVSGAPFVVVEVMGREPDVYGLYFMLNAAGYMFGNFVSGRFARRIGSERLLLTGVILSLISVVLALGIAAVGPWTPATLFVPLALNAIGNGLSIPGGTAAALSVRPELAGTAAGLLGASQLGLGALGALLVAHTVPLWPPSLVLVMFACTATGFVALMLARRARAA